MRACVCVCVPAMSVFVENMEKYYEILVEINVYSILGKGILNSCRLIKMSRMNWRREKLKTENNGYIFVKSSLFFILSFSGNMVVNRWEKSLKPMKED